ncbi:MAG: phosphatidylglycerophosphatase A [Gammaproteobacteria bacterium]|nr:phosphatidylglycerophosphatase A [Gammaproteobacteria bacterium]
MKQSAKRLPVKLLLNPAHFLSFGFGSGYMPFAPGTFGTLAAIPVFLLLSQFSISTYVLISLGMALLGIVLCSYTSQALGVHDHSGIVWDEIVGYLITMFMVPATLMNIAIGFALFRLFDIWKPWPIRQLDKNIHGGLGIMLDDVIAGIFAAIILQIILFLL